MRQDGAAEFISASFEIWYNYSEKKKEMVRVLCVEKAKGQGTMETYCRYCGSRIEVGASFCGRCGKPCASRPNGTHNDAVSGGEGKSGGLWKFFAGTAFGALLANIFGSSHTASAQSTTETRESAQESDSDAPDPSAWDSSCYDELDHDDFPLSDDAEWEEDSSDFNDDHDDFDDYDDYDGGDGE